MTKTKFTFKNYLKELKKSWLLLVIFVILGAAGGAFYAFRKPVQYTATAKVLVNNASVDNAGMASPYSSISELLLSKDLIKETNPDLGDIPEYEVIEAPRGVFQVTVTDTDSEHAKEVANAVINSTQYVIDYAFDNAADYRVTTINEAENTSATVSTKSRIISIVIAAAAMFVLAAVVVFIKFDYSSEK